MAGANVAIRPQYLATDHFQNLCDKLDKLDQQSLEIKQQNVNILQMLKLLLEKDEKDARGNIEEQLNQHTQQAQVREPDFSNVIESQHEERISPSQCTHEVSAAESQIPVAKFHVRSKNLQNLTSWQYKGVLEPSIVQDQLPNVNVAASVQDLVADLQPAQHKLIQAQASDSFLFGELHNSIKEQDQMSKVEVYAARNINNKPLNQSELDKSELELVAAGHIHSLKQQVVSQHLTCSNSELVLQLFLIFLLGFKRPQFQTQTAGVHLRNPNPDALMHNRHADRQVRHDLFLFWKSVWINRVPIMKLCYWEDICEIFTKLYHCNKISSAA